jgi:Uma2 family endonuclease
MTALARPPVRMTAAEFLAWNPDDQLRYQLVDGEPHAIAPTTSIRGFLQSELGRLIGNHLRAHRPACCVIANPGVVPRLMPDHNFRIPDLGVTCAPLTPAQTILPDPLLLVEILSPSNQPETWSNVWAYTSIQSVQELVVLHTSRLCAETLRRDANGGWPQRFESVTDGTLKLASIGLETSLAALYERTGIPKGQDSM